MENQPICSLNTLPTEMAVSILDYLPGEDLISVALVSRELHQTVSQTPELGSRVQTITNDIASIRNIKDYRTRVAAYNRLIIPNIGTDILGITNAIRDLNDPALAELKDQILIEADKYQRETGTTEAKTNAARLAQTIDTIFYRSLETQIGEKDFDGAISNTLLIKNPQDRDYYFSIISGRQSHSDIPGAIKTAAYIQNPERKDKAFSNIAQLQSENDIPGAINTTLKISDPARQNKTFKNIALEEAKKNPHEAMRIAERIKNPEMQEETRLAIYNTKP